MMNLNSASAAEGVNAGSYQSSRRSVESSTKDQFEMFLRMLTTQIKNQDPLNPMENTEFAVQLATFSGVEQQVQTNLLLSQLLSDTCGGGLGQYSNWIGREVRTNSPVWFDGASLSLAMDNITNAEGATLVTLNGQGREVQRQILGAVPGEMQWSGRHADGTSLPAGFYSFRIEEQNSDGSYVARDVEAYSRVTGVELTANGPELVLKGGGSARIDQVSALRE
ncbi:flagellar hook capping FlgD N-terminal domain-containing protein [Paracoccus pantotrophus]|uniref:flagellar hook capping FlgD N-terminal domain-containing protein n=1 Tax=Paracoccus pantotrophus TaxID=82367 RepID=UPI00210BA553|nr:flagellar hook capping FlgD N-terminal domain-containing protein [Paracoccus pantotrophus]MDF3856440.1 flagellar hook capping FlgD N-terminal domain-containing protein [Paracoccus pantotrophus]